MPTKRRDAVQCGRWTPTFRRSLSPLSVNLRMEGTGKKGKRILVTGRGGPSVCETSRLPHFLNNRLTNGGEAVSLMRQPAALEPQEDSWYSFLLESESTPGP
jgi:hypothetical protein